MILAPPTRLSVLWKAYSISRVVDPSRKLFRSPSWNKNRPAVSPSPFFLNKKDPSLLCFIPCRYAWIQQFMIWWTQKQVEYLHRGLTTKPGTLERRMEGAGWRPNLPSPCNFGLDLIPLVQEVLPSACLIGWIPVVILLKDDSVWFPQKTC